MDSVEINEEPQVLLSVFFRVRLFKRHLVHDPHAASTYAASPLVVQRLKGMAKVVSPAGASKSRSKSFWSPSAALKLH